jgi:hypothetical protein
MPAPCIGQQGAAAVVQVDAQAEIGDIAEGLHLANLLQALRLFLAQPTDQAQSQAQGRLPIRTGLQAAIPVAVAHVQRADLDLMPASILQQLVRAVEAHRPAVDQGADEGRRFVALEPAAGIGE